MKSIGVKYIDGRYAKFLLKLWFESNWYFCNVTESRCLQMQSRNKVPNNHFIKSLQKQQSAYVLNIAKFLRTVFLQKIYGGSFFQFVKVTSLSSICRPSLLIQKHNVGWFPLKRFGDLIRVLCVISSNHSNTSLLNNLLKQKLV